MVDSRTKYKVSLRIIRGLGLIATDMNGFSDPVRELSAAPPLVVCVIALLSTVRLIRLVPAALTVPSPIRPAVLRHLCRRGLAHAADQDQGPHAQPDLGRAV